MSAPDITFELLDGRQAAAHAGQRHPAGSAPPRPPRTRHSGNVPAVGPDRARESPADMFHADLHIHSRFSRACSKDCDIEHLSAWALRKGLRVLGTGDFTHPGRAAELRETLIPAEPGLFRVRPELEKRILRDSPAICAGAVRFMLSVDRLTSCANRCLCR
ncbi:MAG: hypothetical protein ACRDNT_30110 [Streptosporangiaceae bacterium]